MCVDTLHKGDNDDDDDDDDDDNNNNNNERGNRKLRAVKILKQVPLVLLI
jgi:hypothetical protein